MSSLDFTAFGLLGVVVTGATLGFGTPGAFVAAGDVGAPLEMVLQTQDLDHVTDGARTPDAPRPTWRLAGRPAPIGGF